MIKKVCALLCTHRWFLMMTLGFLLSSIGFGLTQIVVLGKLGENAAAPLSFAAMFALSLLPSLFSTELGRLLLKKISSLKILIFAELLGACSVFVPWLGIEYGSENLLIISTFLPSLCTGIGMASYSVLVKLNFKEEDFPVVSAIQTLFFSATVFVGCGIGSILYPFVSVNTYLLIDFFSYLCAAYLFYSICNFHSIKQNDNQTDPQQTQFKLQLLRGKKLRSLSLSGLLACVTAPAMALLPAIGWHFNGMTLAGFVVAPTLLLVFARSVGQLLGSFVLGPEKINVVFNKSLALLLLCSGFIFFYLLVFTYKNLWIILLSVVIAHVFSNIIYVVAQSALFRNFSETEIAEASVRSCQVQLIVLVTFSLISGWIANRYSPVISFLLFSLPSLILFYAVLISTKEEVVSVQ